MRLFLKLIFIFSVISNSYAQNTNTCFNALNGNISSTVTIYDKEDLSDAQIEVIAEILEIELYNHEANFRKVLLQKGYDEQVGFHDTSKAGYWRFRVKEKSSIANKLKRLIKSGVSITNLDDARKALPDGIGARLVLDNPNAESMKIFTSEVVQLIKSRELRLLSLENHHGTSGTPYLKDSQVQQIISTAEKMGTNRDNITVINGKGAKRNSGYTSLHINALLPSGAQVELQVRGSLLDQFGDISHLFYDARNNKPANPHSLAIPELKTAIQEFLMMDHETAKVYGNYLAKFFTAIRAYTTGQKVILPKLPTPQFSKTLSVAFLAQAYDHRKLRDFSINHEDFNIEKEEYEFFSSIRHLVQTQPKNILNKILGNVSQGSMRRFRQMDIQAERQALLIEMNGLSFVDVIFWEEHPFNKHRRDVIRSGEKWPGHIELPLYNTEKQGNKSPGTIEEVSVKELHFMQDSAKNKSGEYTIIGNAKALKAGILSIDIFPPLQVWRDQSGKIWSLDHRRLAAYILSGVIDKAPVVFVDKAAVEADRFKMSNSDRGKSIIMHLPESNLAYIIIN